MTTSLTAILFGLKTSENSRFFVSPSNHVVRSLNTETVGVEERLEESLVSVLNEC